MQGRAGQVRDGGLERTQAVAGRQERVPSKGNDYRLLFGVSTVLCGVFGPIAASCTNARLRHFTTVLGFSPCCAASFLNEAFDRCSAALTACVVVAQP